MHTSMYIYTHIPAPPSELRYEIHTQMHAYIYVYIHTHTRAAHGAEIRDIYTDACIHLCIHIHTYPRRPRSPARRAAGGAQRPAPRVPRLLLRLRCFARPPVAWRERLLSKSTVRLNISTEYSNLLLRESGAGGWPRPGGSARRRRRRA